MPMGRCRIHQKTSMCNSGVLGYLEFARFLMNAPCGGASSIHVVSVFHYSLRTEFGGRPSAPLVFRGSLTLALTPTASAQPARFARAGCSGGGCGRLLCSTAHMGRNEPFRLAFGVGHCVTSFSALGDFALLL